MLYFPDENLVRAKLECNSNDFGAVALGTCVFFNLVPESLLNLQPPIIVEGLVDVS